MRIIHFVCATIIFIVSTSAATGCPTPNQPIVDSRFVNAVIEDVSPIPLAKLLPGYDEAEILAEQFGGWWLGGKAYLTTESICFSANILNSLIHRGITELTIPFDSIQKLNLDGGILTTILIIKFSGGTLKIRGFYMDDFLKSAEQLIQKHKS